MHEAEPVGHLLVNGRQPSLRQIASIAGATQKEVMPLMAELEEAGVYSRTKDGVIYCRRMVRDAAASEEGREHIAKRWANRGPNSPPNRGPTNKPNGEATRGPNTLEAEAEAEAEEEPPYPHAVGEGTPAEPGTPPRRRANGTNPRATGTNPRSRPAEIPWRSGAIQLVYEEGMAAKAAEEAAKAEKDRLECEGFIAQRRLRHGAI
jgi:hypothetical protein